MVLIRLRLLCQGRPQGVADEEIAANLDEKLVLLRTVYGCEHLAHEEVLLTYLWYLYDSPSDSSQLQLHPVSEGETDAVVFESERDDEEHKSNQADYSEF